MGRVVRVRVVCQVRELACWVAVGRGHGVSSKLAVAEEVQGMREVELACGLAKTCWHLCMKTHAWWSEGVGAATTCGHLK